MDKTANFVARNGMDHWLVCSCFRHVIRAMQSMNAADIMLCAMSAAFKLLIALIELLSPYFFHLCVQWSLYNPAPFVPRKSAGLGRVLD